MIDRARRSQDQKASDEGDRDGKGSFRPSPACAEQLAARRISLRARALRGWRATNLSAPCVGAA